MTAREDPLRFESGGAPCKDDVVLYVVDRHGRQVGIIELTLDDGCLHVTVNQLDDTLGPVKTTVL